MSTIAAIATAYSQSISGGIGIIRISGEKSLDILHKLFVPRSPIKKIKPRYAYYGSFLDTKGEYLDEGLILYMQKPFSYTAEDVVELHCHGNPHILNALLQSCLFHGADLAKAGEFTKRAFLNGRLDLSQAEAVAEILSAPTLESSRLAEAKLAGSLGKKIHELREKLEKTMQYLLYELDFSEEELPNIDTFVEEVKEIRRQIEKLLLAYERTIPLKDGLLIVLAGKVNAGKSSLFNSLLGRYRAIVTPKAGTTRDYIEETLRIKDIPIRLVDTAGIRGQEETSDIIELEGINKAYKLFEKAALILYILDTDSHINIDTNTKKHTNSHLYNEYDEKDKENILFLQNINPHIPLLQIWNKCDKNIFTEKQDEEISEKIYPISAKNEKGIDELVEVIYSHLSSFIPQADELIPNLRQAHLLEKARNELDIFCESVETVPLDALAFHLQQTLHILSEITGEICTEDIVNEIFSHFCIGK